MPTSLNPLLVDTGSPPIPEAYGWTERYDGRLGALINMSQAVPSDPPPAALQDRLVAAAADPATARYGAIGGDEALKTATAGELNAIYGGDVAAAEVAITAGCNLGFVVAMLAVARAGDNVLLPAPWYFNHEMALQMLGIEARVLPATAATGFVPEPAVAMQLADARTRAVVLVTPNNPTGAVYPRETIEQFRRLARERGLWLVLDETYRDFLPEGMSRPHGLFETPDWRDNVMTMFSFSKAYCIPGYRLGAIAAPPLAMREIEKALDTVQICPPRAAQAALAWGIGALGDWRAGNRREINRRAAVFRTALAQANAWQLSSIGAYFAYVKHPFTGVPARRVAEVLAAERGVLALPGSYFGPGQDDHLRIAFANVGADRIAELPERLRGLAVG